MIRKPKIGLLPMYLKLYDDIMPERRSHFEPFLDQVEKGFRTRGVDVIRARVCRLEAEFDEAVDHFESAEIDLIVTLHLAYSPSLESIEPLTETDLPILMLDTTMDVDFGKDVSADRIMFNHGIHGVQDLACMLRRLGKPYQIVAGHVSESPVLDRAADIARGAYAAVRLADTEALRIGAPFPGMGDFSVEEAVMEKEIGVTVDTVTLDELAIEVSAVSDEAVKEEMAADRSRFDVRLDEEVHQRSVRVGLGVRNLLENGDYTAFSANFLAFDTDQPPVNVVPFLEACKAMSRGIGYGGEGDVFTASLVGALASAFGQTTFTEIFCPDWKGNAVFLSHMGEINPDVVAGKASLIEKNYPFSKALNPAVVVGAPAAGPAVFVNLAPGPESRFGLIATPVEVLGDSDNDSLKDAVRGWIRPHYELPDFLEDYSLNGGTHHSALVMGKNLEGIAAFADFAGLEAIIL